MTTTASRLWRTLVRVRVNRLVHKPPSRLESGALTPQAALRNKTSSPETLWVIILPISSNGLLCAPLPRKYQSHATETTKTTRNRFNRSSLPFRCDSFHALFLHLCSDLSCIYVTVVIYYTVPLMWPRIRDFMEH